MGSWARHLQLSEMTTCLTKTSPSQATELTLLLRHLRSAATPWLARELPCTNRRPLHQHHDGKREDWCDGEGKRSEVRTRLGG